MVAKVKRQLGSQGGSDSAASQSTAPPDPVDHYDSRIHPNKVMKVDAFLKLHAGQYIPEQHKCLRKQAMEKIKVDMMTLFQAGTT